MNKFSETIDFDAIKQANPLDAYCRNHGIELDKYGIGQCPIHGETNGHAFAIKRYKGRWGWICRGKCLERYPKGGDVIDLEVALGGGTVREAAKRLGGGTSTATPVARTPDPMLDPVEVKRKQIHPKLSKPAASVLKTISDLRSIGLEALEIAVERGLLWVAALKGHPAWVITDQTHNSYLARRLDGEPWEHLGSKPKAWLLPGSRGNWAIGIQESGPYPAIALCEGGPDFLSAFAHAWASGVEDRVAPVCMASSSGSIADDALPYFRGKAVRVFVHDDDAGWDACSRWQKQILEVARSHSFYTFNNLVQADTKPIKDLNDLLRLDYDNWEQNREAVEAVMDFAQEDRN
jgi:hypothetical protein